ncbi:N-carbamoyl-D-amino acid hydrolase [Rhodovastum atsumiense]|uniref:N-carbamoyl-D-amino-acid hydrolase n=1 Tax=Rhodovastum atsumiense TaxID=504468 RepID=A0A5M6IWF6_9PROT|nr:N-carbamoyl-D-amino-acid hydrolase [Rhodovastum atsumiense]KAA5612167.1 N-carbamoyl-D-amino-acid hydrolase [Rhodovastum atsumiense]CAH2603882.1 N-carbamoyl-D-amino acid hydrolase [Rhodovastum atsumiense]
MTKLVVGGAQMGPIQKADSRELVVARMIALLEQAAAQGVQMLVYPELALTTFFPRWYMTDQAEVDAWFEREMPNPATLPLFRRAGELGVAISFGYAELTPEGRHFNSSILTNRAGEIIGKYRKVHLPGHVEYQPTRGQQHLEKRYFEPGDLGFNVWRNEGVVMGMAICNDRRWPETYRCLGLQGVELVTIGYNTPSVNGHMKSEGREERLYHSELVMTSGAYQNATYVVGVAKAGVEDGYPLMGGSIIVDPNGFVLARAAGEGDEIILAECDFAKCAFGKTTIFNFAEHRRIEHYGRITAQTGAVVDV